MVSRQLGRHFLQGAFELIVLCLTGWSQTFPDDLSQFMLPPIVRTESALGGNASLPPGVLPSTAAIRHLGSPLPFPKFRALASQPAKS